ncbi:MAG: hypothetical protein QXO67_05135, partial [Candidatus Bathyarchaeia archaeon]
MKKAYISDCEGPISKNDNAFELTAHYVPSGAHVFTVISRYDDVLADVLKRPGYKAGDTLKLILPFLKAYGVTDRKMRVFSAKTLVLIPKVREALGFIQEFMEAFIVSTSYEPYIRALCRVINFPFKNTYCTRVEIDKYELKEEEKTRLKELVERVTKIVESRKIGALREELDVLPELVVKERDVGVAKEAVVEIMKLVGGELKSLGADEIKSVTDVIMRGVNEVGKKINAQGITKVKKVEELEELKFEVAGFIGKVYEALAVGLKGVDDGAIERVEVKAE